MVSARDASEPAPQPAAERRPRGHGRPHDEALDGPVLQQAIEGLCCPPPPRQIEEPAENARRLA